MADTALFEELLKRMRAKGINIVEADDSSKMQDAGFLFRIAFTDGVYAGYIERPVRHSDPDGDGKDECFQTDYVLVITQAIHPAAT